MRGTMATIQSVLVLALWGAIASFTEARSLQATATTYVLAFFGDSATDTGNTFREAGVPDPAVYYKGRYTNGPTWVDQLNATLAQKYTVKTFNYAYGGATACSSPLMSAAFPFVKDLSNQTAAFLSDLKSGKIPSGKKKIKVLPIQWIGGNDVSNTMQLAGGNITDSLVRALVEGTVSCRLQSAMTLAAAGLKDIVLLPMSPMHLSPAVPAAFKPMLTQLEQALDTALAAAVASAQAQLDALPAGSAGGGAVLHLLGDYSWIEKGKTAVKPAYKNVTGSCFIYPGSPLTIAPGAKPCAKPDDYMFYDQMHVGSRFHEWLAIKGVLPRLQQLRLLPKF